MNTGIRLEPLHKELLAKWAAQSEPMTLLTLNGDNLPSPFQINANWDLVERGFLVRAGFDPKRDTILFRITEAGRLALNQPAEPPRSRRQQQNATGNQRANAKSTARKS